MPKEEAWVVYYKGKPYQSRIYKNKGTAEYQIKHQFANTVYLESDFEAVKYVPEKLGILIGQLGEEKARDVWKSKVVI